MHNSKAVNAVVAFRELKRATNSDYSFFQAADIFVEALPELETSVHDLLPTVANLDREADDDLGGMRLRKTFCTLCLNRPNWLTDSLGMIERAPDKFHRLLSPLLVQCASSEECLVAKAVQLTAHASLQIRISALHAMSQFDWAAHRTLVGSAMEAVEHRTREDFDPPMMRLAISAALKLSAACPDQEGRSRLIIERLLAEHPAVCIPWAAQQMAWHSASWSDQTIALVLSSFRLVSAAEAIPTIDLALAALFGTSRHLEALAALEDLITRFGRMDDRQFCASSRAIKARASVRNLAATRWLLSPVPSIARSTRAIATPRMRPNSALAAEPSELESENFNLIGFLARKAIGHLFDHPYDLASFLISLIRLARTEEVRGLVASYLQDLILENYPGDVSAFVAEISTQESPQTKAVIDKAWSLAQDYHKELGSVSSVRSLRPSRADRYAYQLCFSRMVRKAQEEGTSQSPLLSSFPRSILLYGRASIDHVADLSGNVRRMTTNLQTVESYIELPVARLIDPVGLERLLAAFRVERMPR